MLGKRYRFSDDISKPISDICIKINRETSSLCYSIEGKIKEIIYNKGYHIIERLKAKYLGKVNPVLFSRADKCRTIKIGHKTFYLKLKYSKKNIKNIYSIFIGNRFYFFNERARPIVPEKRIERKERKIKRNLKKKEKIDINKYIKDSKDYLISLFKNKELELGEKKDIILQGSIITYSNPKGRIPFTFYDHGKKKEEIYVGKYCGEAILSIHGNYIFISDKNKQILNSYEFDRILCEKMQFINYGLQHYVTIKRINLSEKNIIIGINQDSFAFSKIEIKKREGIAYAILFEHNQIDEIKNFNLLVQKKDGTIEEYEIKPRIFKGKKIKAGLNEKDLNYLKSWVDYFHGGIVALHIPRYNISLKISRKLMKVFNEIYGTKKEKTTKEEEKAFLEGELSDILEKYFQSNPNFEYSDDISFTLKMDDYKIIIKEGVIKEIKIGRIDSFL